MWPLKVICMILPVLGQNIDTENAVVYVYPTQSTRLSYFGMTVALKAYSRVFGNASWSVMVGAPRGNSSFENWIEPGTVYKCHLAGPCEEYPMEIEKNSGPKAGQLERNGAWIGVTMDVDTLNRTVICGHRITTTSTQTGRVSGYLPIGGCYVELQNTSAWRYPLKNDDKMFQMSTNGKRAKYWGWGLAGMSATLMDAPTMAMDKGLLLGAPHIFQNGALVRMNLDSNGIVDQSTGSTKVGRNNEHGYFGYSVAYVRHLEYTEVTLLMGAPRAFGVKGLVLQIKFTGVYNSVETYKTIETFSGDSLGAYFGASTATGDLNNDGCSDIVIGAPMSSSSEDIEFGRVFIYLCDHKGRRSPIHPAKIRQVFCGKDRSRFGSSLAYAGDLNGDGYGDLAVGAPGQGEHGAVHIIYWQESEISRRIQVISATELDVAIKGFGISFSRPVDVDGNSTPDLAVGAYLSDHAVLLRSRPYVSIAATIEIKPKLERNATNVNGTICLLCNSTEETPCIVQAELFINDSQNKVQFLREESMGKNHFMKNDQISKLRPYCENVTLQVKPISDIIWRPFKIIVESTFIPREYANKVVQVWNKTSILAPVWPVVKERTVSTIETVSFVGDCGEDNICHTALVTSCQLLNSKLLHVIGASTHPKVFQISVTNKGEPSPNTTLTVSIEGMERGDIRVKDCNYDEEKMKYFCVLGYLAGDEQVLSRFELQVTNWGRSKAKSIKILAETETGGQQGNVSGLSCMSEIKLHSRPAIRMKTTPNSTVNVRQDLVFTHTFEVVNSGVSPVEIQNLTAKFPVAICNTDVAHLHLNDGQSAVTLADENDNADVIKRCTTSLKKLADNGKLVIDCSNKQVVCKTVIAPDTLLNLTLFLESSIFNDTSIKEVVYVTTGTAMAMFPFLEERMFINNSFTTFMGNGSAPINLTVLAMSVIGGSLLILLIVPILVKLGFFRRKTKEKMEAIKIQDIINQRFSMYEPFDRVDDVDLSCHVSVETLNEDDELQDLRITEST